MSDQGSKKPNESRQFDRVQAALWLNEGEREVGDNKKDFWTFTVSRSFKGEDGQWRRVHSFTERDLPHVALAIDWAMDQLKLKSQ